jgi:SprT-like family protein
MQDSMTGTTVNGQLPLSFGRTESSLERHFNDRLGRPVTLVLTGNSTTMLSARMHHDVLHVRLHRMFLEADSPVIDEIVSFLKNRRGRMPSFRRFIRDRREQLREKPPNKVSIRTAGKVYDLGRLYRGINEEYFGGMVTAAITWGTRSSRSSARKRTLGSYNERSQTIRINPLLDKKTVPPYFIAFIVYHEMLHAALGVGLQGARRSIHPREFRRREKLFKEYDRAAAWERGKG